MDIATPASATGQTSLRRRSSGPCGEGDRFRHRPAQKRSAATVEAILTAAADLVATQGLPAFNTNAVAKAAGINVATLYHYFPDKTAILLELFERNERERQASSRPLIEALSDSADIGSWIAGTIAALGDQRREQRSGVALRRAMRATPELLAVEESVNAATADQLAAALHARFPRLARDRAHIVARTLIAITAGMLDAADNAPPSVAEAIICELARLGRCYLEDIARD